MSDEQGYNGWKNYETWSVALIVDNDERTYSQRQNIVRLALMEARADDQPESWTPDEHRRYRVADAIKDWVEWAAEIEHDVAESQPFSFLWSQLISAALSEVDWDELARHWIDDAIEAEA